MRSKCQNYAPARGPPKSAEGRSRGKGKGECFAPFIKNACFFVWKCCFFVLETLSSWSGMISKKSSFFQFFVKIAIFVDGFSDRPKSSRRPIKLILRQVNALIEFWINVWGFINLSSISIKSMVSKCQNYAPARGPPKLAKGRSRGKGKGECFVPFIKNASFLVWKCCVFVLETLSNWSGMVSKKSSFF